MDQKPLLEVRNLNIQFPNKSGFHTVVENISFELQQGEILGIVGESGSGKTMTALSIIGLLSNAAHVSEGSLLFSEKELLSMNEKERRSLKGNEISMIFQEPMTSLNPVMKIGKQVEEVLHLHDKFPKEKLRKKTLEMLRNVGLDADLVYQKYPHQLSGGMRQRVMIAMAMICEPKLMIADEPTTALDVTVQEQILQLIQKLNQEHGTAVIFISHDLGVVKSICSRAVVMCKGKIVESGSVEELFHNPKKDYTKKLLEAVPARQKNKSHNSFIMDRQRTEVLVVDGLNVYYKEKQNRPLEGPIRRQVLKDISCKLYKGEILGIVGESGSGKSTLAKSIVGLVDDLTGTITTNGLNPQMVFQDPYGSLNPSKKIEWILEEPLKIQGGYTKDERKRKVKEILEQVGLEEQYAKRYVSQLSGGQRQRIGIACALMSNSKVIILDEPVSSLDVTVQMQILKLLLHLREKYELSYLFISHDLNVIRQMCDRVCVLYHGEIIETAEVEELFCNPKQNYTKALLESVPKWW